jgi:SAM-dependent methyltransferase
VIATPSRAGGQFRSPQEATRCPVCNSRRSAGRFQARDFHYGNQGVWWERKCADCGSYRLDPMPSHDELVRMYPQEDYYAYRLKPRSPVRELAKRLLGISFDTREPAFAAPGRMLDFGCGAGDFLIRMRDRGWTCAGVEVNDAAIRVAQNHGFTVRKSLAEYGDAEFDYVRANHALEHVPDPAAVLFDMYRVLKPGGTLFIGVPTNDGQTARLFGPYWWYLGAPVHPVTFSTRGLTELVRATGFEVVKTSTNSDWGSVVGSLQIFLNRRARRPSSHGVILSLKPLLVLGHWLAKLQDLAGLGDKLELIATKRA